MRKLTRRRRREDEKLFVMKIDGPLGFGYYYELNDTPAKLRRTDKNGQLVDNKRSPHQHIIILYENTTIKGLENFNTSTA